MRAAHTHRARDTGAVKHRPSRAIHAAPKSVGTPNNAIKFNSGNIVIEKVAHPVSHNLYKNSVLWRNHADAIMDNGTSTLIEPLKNTD